MATQAPVHGQSFLDGATLGGARRPRMSAGAFVALDDIALRLMRDHPSDYQLMARWLTIPGARPHWAKQYQDLPGIAATLRAVYGSHLDTFLQIRCDEGFDPDNVFGKFFFALQKRPEKDDATPSASSDLSR